MAGKLADQPHPEGDEEYLLFKLVTCHYWGRPGTDLGPMLFNVFISNWDDVIKCILMKFADDTKLTRKADASEGRAILQEDLDRLEEIKIAIRDEDVVIPVSAFQATSEILWSVLVPIIQKRCGQGGEGLEKGYKDNQMIGKPVE